MALRAASATLRVGGAALGRGGFVSKDQLGPEEGLLKAPAQSRNITVSAERSCVSRGWVLAQRICDAEFDAPCRAAIGACVEALEAHAGRTPPKGWGHLDGIKLVVRGTGGSGGGKRVQIARARAGQITAAVEDRFLAALAATCNVKAACMEGG